MIPLNTVFSDKYFGNNVIPSKSRFALDSCLGDMQLRVGPNLTR